MEQYVFDYAELLEHLDIRDAVLVGRSTGGGEVAKYIGRHGTARVSNAVLVSAVPPIMFKTSASPGGLPIEVFDGIRKGVAENRTQFYQDLSLPFFGYNRPGAKVSEGILENFWRMGMQSSVKGQYDCVDEFSEVDYTEDLKMTIPTLIVQGDDDQIVPIDDSGRRSVNMLREPSSKSIRVRHTGFRLRTRISSTRTCWNSFGADAFGQRGVHPAAISVFDFH